MGKSRNTNIRDDITEVFRRTGTQLSPSEVSEELPDSTVDNVRQTMRRMKKGGELDQPEKWGPYQLPSGGNQTSQLSADEATREVARTESPEERKQLEDMMRKQTSLTVYPDVRPQCGDGNIIFDQTTRVEIQMPSLLLEKLLGFRPPPVMGMMMCQGDSMSPVFEEDDPLLYRPSPDVASDGNYSFYLDDRLRAKRVEVIPGGGYKLISANTRAGYGHYRLVPGDNGSLVNADTENEVGFQPIGKILWPRRDTGRLNVDQVADLLHSVVQQNR